MNKKIDNNETEEGYDLLSDSRDVAVIHSEQMDLFSILERSAKQRQDHSNLIDIYDAIPKYVWSGREAHDLKNATVVRSFKINGKAMTVKLKPALIEKSSEESVLIYPGEREELVEDCLRKLAVTGNGVFIYGKAGVTFTLYELRKELKRTGHTYSFNEIKEALLVCRGSLIECELEDGSSMVNSSLFGLLSMTTRKDYEKRSDNIKDDASPRCYVQFNPLVNESIINLTYRQYNYKVGMDIRSPLARFIYKRMAQYWTQASPENLYSPSLISFLSQSPRGVTGVMKNDLRAMRGALDTLIKHEVILEYEETLIREGKQKIIDARYSITPHPNFVREIIGANQIQKKRRLEAIRHGLRG